MTLKVIGAGFGRTGTDSMRTALGMLGLGPCHHMREVNANAENRERWRALALGAAPDWDRLFEGYASCMDWPAAHYWRELTEVYPEAKVILTWRSPESWWASVEKTILRNLREDTEADHRSLGRTLIAAQVFGGRPHDRDHAIATYRRHVEEVLDGVPPGRLLVHRLGDGWEPLCAHLGLPVPDMPYPHANTTAAFNAS